MQNFSGLSGLGIIGAMAQEVEQLKEAMEQPEIQTVAGMEFYKKSEAKRS